MFSFIKQLFSSEKIESVTDLFERSLHNVVNNGGGHGDFSASNMFQHSSDDGDTDWHLRQAVEDHHTFMDDHEEMTRQFNEQNQINQDMQQLQDMHDPFTNPGQDMIIDEQHHGIDHGLGMNDMHDDHF